MENMTMHLFANAEASTSFLPPEFWPGLVMSVVYLAVAMVSFAILWKFIDWITPGELDKELLGTPETKAADGTVVPGKAPNLALGVVVAALIVGFCLIITAAIK